MIDEVLTKPVTLDLLKKVARAYYVPAITPFSTDPEAYRSLISPEEEGVVTDSDIARFSEEDR